MLLFETGIFCDFHLDMAKDLQASGTGITSIGQYVQPRLGFGGRRITQLLVFITIETCFHTTICSRPWTAPPVCVSSFSVS